MIDKKNNTYLLTESANGSKSKRVSSLPKNRIRLECILQTCGDVNRNHRRYSASMMKEGIEKIQSSVKRGALLGELDHPTDISNPGRQFTVLYKEASHQFREIGMDGNNVVAIVDTLSTPRGQVMKALVDDGVPVGFSFRGMGDIREINEGGSTIYEVNPPLNIVTWDSVSNPSHSNARMIRVTESVMTSICESVGFETFRNGVMYGKFGAAYVPRSKNDLLEEYIFNMSKKYRNVDLDLIRKNILG